MEEEKKSTCVQEKFNKGAVLVQRGGSNNRMAVLTRGTVEASYRNMKLLLQPGAIMDVTAVDRTECMMDYTAAEDGEMTVFEYSTLDSFRTFLGQEEKNRSTLINGCMQQVKQLYGAREAGMELLERVCGFAAEKYHTYRELCARTGCDARSNTPLEHAEEWKLTKECSEVDIEYFRVLDQMEQEKLDVFFETADAVVLHHIEVFGRMAGSLVEECVSLSELLENKLGLLCSEENVNLLMLFMEVLKSGALPKDMIEELLHDMQETAELYGQGIRILKEQLYVSTQLSVRRFKLLCDNVAAYYNNSAQNADEGHTDMLDVMQGMTDKLLDYSGLDEEFCDQFHRELKAYMEMTDKTSTEDVARALRKRLTNLFYQLYQAVFFRAEDENRHNAVIELFLNYGIVEEKSFSEEVLQQLLESVRSRSENLPVKVYSIREWLHEIYMGSKEPSINEFDMDYEKYLREENKSRGPLTPEEEERQNSTKEKTKFEMRNFFVINNRLTNGHMLTFCPVMTGEDLGTNVQGIRIDARRINEAFERVRKIDFSIFYRMIMYDDRENGIKNMQIHQEVLPEVVLMPNVGSLGRMWQEISGKRRATPGRFTFPAFMLEDLNKQVVQAIGSFRWEICKREQGTRWNDVTEPSLTSEFCDYLQFYRKNRDLTDKAREKVAQLMTKCRNNYGKIFVYNYICWIDSESAGNVRIDKVSRNILGRYCPFSRDIREKLLQQPLFAEPLGRYERERMKKVKELSHYRAAIRNANGVETEQFLQEVDFYEL